MMSELKQSLVTFTTSNHSTAEEQPPDDDELEIIIEQSTAEEQPEMVMSKSARWVIPVFDDLVGENMHLETEHYNIFTKATIAFFMMPVILFVTVLVSDCNPRYASLGIALWFSIVYDLCSLIYLCWLKKKELALVKIRVKTAEMVLKLRKRLPMVEVGNVEADQFGNTLINFYCDMATTTFPLHSILNYLIYFAARVGCVGILLCGKDYWSRHTYLMFGVPVNVVNMICVGRDYYYLRKSSVKCPPV